MSDQELEAEIERLTFSLGYTQAGEGEILSVDLDENKFLCQGPNIVDFTREELNDYMRLGGYVSNENGKEN